MPTASYALTYASLRASQVATIYIINGLDADVHVQIYANREASEESAVQIGSPFTVAEGRIEAKTLTVEACGWLPYIFLRVRCLSTPTYGSLTAYRVRSKTEQDILFDALEIRDMNMHTSLIIEW